MPDEGTVCAEMVVFTKNLSGAYNLHTIRMRNVNIRVSFILADFTLATHGTV